MLKRRPHNSGPALILDCMSGGASVMRIFDTSPSDWQELQNMVGQLFAEIGCEVRLGEPLGNVRGTKEIDVYALDVAVVPHALYLCECKHWKRAVPQEVVHSFRTVLLDVGAHRGFIVSSGGFQKGAYEAATNTNIDLVSFEELQAIFFDRWRLCMGQRFIPYADRLFPYWTRVAAECRNSNGVIAIGKDIGS